LGPLLPFFVASTMCSDYLCLNLCLEDGLECLSISCELPDTIGQLLGGHLVLVEVEAEKRLVSEVSLLGDLEA
jgi:hypothetical protein